MTPQLRLVSPGGPDPDSPYPVAQQLLERFAFGKGDLTLSTYQGDLRAFAKFMFLDEQIISPSVEAAISSLITFGPSSAYGVLLDYQSFLQSQVLQNVTINRKIAPLRSLLRLARQTGLIAWDAAPRSLKVEAYRDTRGPQPEEYRQLLAEAEIRTDPKGFRDLAIIRLLRDLALRRSSIVWLDLGDFSPNQADMGLAPTEPTLWVREKGKREKVLKKIPDLTARAINAWIAARGDEPGPLFTNLHRNEQRHGRISHRSINRLIESVGKAIGMKLTPHMLRHSGITQAVALAGPAGYSLPDVMQYSGHKNLRTLQVYVDNHRNVQGKIAALVEASA